ASPTRYCQRRSEIIAAFRSACQHLRETFFKPPDVADLHFPSPLTTVTGSCLISEARNYSNTFEMCKPLRKESRGRQASV
ncbi:hypothetical protein, partial [Inhella inkyongensis]|uniref:hypothetical protein n=1 Tax=Inhella inkyongensis TaxID=392593 RepID=UPI001C866CE1